MTASLTDVILAIAVGLTLLIVVIVVIAILFDNRHDDEER